MEPFSECSKKEAGTFLPEWDEYKMNVRLSGDVSLVSVWFESTENWYFEMQTDLKCIWFKIFIPNQNIPLIPSSLCQTSKNSKLPKSQKTLNFLNLKTKWNKDGKEIRIHFRLFFVQTREFSVRLQSGPSKKFTVRGY